MKAIDYIVCTIILLFVPTRLPAGPPAPPHGKTWVLLFEDDFEQDRLDPAKWTVGQEWPQNDCHYPSRTIIDGRPLVQVKDGTARLYAWDRPFGGKPYTGSLIKTRRSAGNSALFAFKYGYVETRVKRTAQGNGFHMNCYTYGYDPSEGSDNIGYHRWPPEIDYAETVSSSSGENRIWQALHVKVRGKKKDDGKWIENVNWSAWQTYGCWWKDSREVLFYIDDERTFHPAAPFLPDVEQYLVLRMGVGGWGAEPDGNTRFPAIQEVDWIRVWQLIDAADSDAHTINHARNEQLNSCASTPVIPLSAFSKPPFPKQSDCNMAVAVPPEKRSRNPDDIDWPAVVTIDYTSEIITASPYVFGATQPRGLSEKQWDTLVEDGFTFARSQADLTRLVPAAAPDDYRANRDGCAEPLNWDWKDGIYGGNFARKAIDRGMKVCLTIKNARWNRYDGAPDDEETMPRDLKVWKDIVTKIVNHYQGGISCLEIFNEVDREPQFRIEASPFTRKTGYRQVVRTALEAVAESDYPDTLVGAPAAALVGARQIQWLLEDDKIQDRLGCLTFHEFDCPVYPQWAAAELRTLASRYNHNFPILRTSYVPEFGRSGGRPGTTDPVYIAPMIIGALKDGLAANSLWEIQNRSGDDDWRYWFDGEDTVQTAQLYRMMSRALKLGRGPSIIVGTTGPFAHTLGAINCEGERIAVFAAPKACRFEVCFKSFETDEHIQIERFRADARHAGLIPVHIMRKRPQNGRITLQIDLQAGAVLGMRFCKKP